MNFNRPLEIGDVVLIHCKLPSIDRFEGMYGEVMQILEHTNSVLVSVQNPTSAHTNEIIPLDQTTRMPFLIEFSPSRDLEVCKTVGWFMRGFKEWEWVTHIHTTRKSILVYSSKGKVELIRYMIHHLPDVVWCITSHGYQGLDFPQPEIDFDKT